RPASPSGGTMARAGRAGLCPAAAGRRAHESRLGRRPWRLYHASVERRRVAELENYRSHARIACRRGKHARPILFSRWPLGRAGRPVVERAARRTRARSARSERAFTVRDARARRLPRRSLWPGRLVRYIGPACGMVRQRWTFARLHPKTNDWAQIGGLARALLAAPLRYRYFDHTPGAERWRHRICRRRAFSRRRVLRRALFLCIGLSRTRSCG